MIDLYTWATPNSLKIHIMLEETELDYTSHRVNIGAEEQFKPAFLRINPNNKVPAIVDRDGPGGQPVSIFESGAILFYLAEKTGRFFASETRDRTLVMQWLMFQMANIGPMMGQLYHFRSVAPERVPYALERYGKEVRRILGVLEKRCEEVEYLAGDYSIADMAAWPWLRYAPNLDFPWTDFPRVKKWHDRVVGRPAVQKAIRVMGEDED
ncbi:MAG TPA: glutathione S-transferase N-terminal domain-containing protein [Dongiaceae bacterium]|jgi:GST-like protein|nr:glutathione S-transferase N-terminal domain-containing protein [Dongiaceae bacterium]